MIAQVPIGISKFDNVDLNSQCDRKGPKRPKNLNPLFIYYMEFSTNSLTTLSSTFTKITCGRRRNLGNIFVNNFSGIPNQKLGNVSGPISD